MSSDPQELLYDDALKVAHMVEARANGLADDMVKSLEAVRFTLLARMAELQEKTLASTSWEEQTLARRKAYLEAQREAVDSIISEVYSGMGGTIQEAAQDAMQYSTTAQAASLQTAFGFGGGAANVTTAMVANWTASSTVDGLTIGEWLNTLGKSTADRIVAAGREALIMGLGSRETAALLRDKGIQGSVPGLENLARTFLMSASNDARDNAAERLLGNMLKGWRYVATLDGRTCPICGVDDHKFFPVDESRPRLPRHFSCRCLYVPAVREPDQVDQVERPATKHESRTVHHRDGSTSTKFRPVSSEMTTENYSQWIKRQMKDDPDFVRTILGKTRYDLFKSGKINLDKMVVDGRLKRISELPK